MKTLLLTCFALVLSMAACKKSTKGKTQENTTPVGIQKVFDENQPGEIYECMYEGKTVFYIQDNAVDVSTLYFDEAGNHIGTCNFQIGRTDAICEGATDCKAVFRVGDNVWGKEVVNIYGL